MRGHSSVFSRRIAVTFGVTLLALATATSVDAVGTGRPAPQTTKLQEQTKKLDARAHRALLDLYSIETRLGRAQSRLVALQLEAAHIRAEQRLVRQQARITRHVLVSSRRQLAARLRVIYEHGRADALSVLLGSTSLETAISSLDSLSRTDEQDRDVIRQTTATSHSLVRLRKVLALRGARLASLTREAAAEAAALQRAELQRSMLVTSLRARAHLKRRLITRLQAAAQAAEAKSQQLVSSLRSGPVEAGVSESFSSPEPLLTSFGAQTITVVATGYSLDGRTATGLPVGWGIAAVDPSVIPLGTRITIPGYGKAVASDTGSAIRGAVIDLWFPTLAEARAWGRRTVTIAVG